MYWAASLRKLRVHSLMHNIALRKDVSEFPQEGMEEILSREWLTLWRGITRAQMEWSWSVQKGQNYQEVFQAKDLDPLGSAQSGKGWGGRS